MSKKDGSIEYQCRTSEVVVEGVAEYIETDECVQCRLVGLIGSLLGFHLIPSLSLSSWPSFALLLVTKSAPTLLTFTSIWLPGRVRIFSQILD
ncbi:hypothetical protein ACFX1Z_032573 [Malus domestica]